MADCSTFAHQMENLTESNRSRPVAVWLLVGVFMIIVQIILGGITRLTDSGLSITEWQPILGTLPPLSDAGWNKAFEGYKQIAQYKQLHSYFTLEDFKAIFFWEWLHRLWGRLIGIVFIIPFSMFLVQKRFTKEMVRPMIILFLLGGLQGLIGWIMVMSGLNNEDLYVSHIRLAIHFIVALLLLVYTFWFALQLLISEGKRVQLTGARNRLVLILILLVIQLIYGAFMAGLKAAPSAPSWPTINGEWIPANLSNYAGREHSFFSAIINNPIAVHFIHRNLAYLLFVLILAWSFTAAAKRNPVWNASRYLPVVLVLLQVILGISTVLASPYKKPQAWGGFEWNALLHQFVAMLLLLSLVFSYYVAGGKKSLR
ncbi:MAG: COX15/CtaA family protein [Flavisolibacter sp.]